MASKRIVLCLLFCGLWAAGTAAWADVNFQPYEFSQYVGDARFFEKWEEYPFDREPYANEGLFVSWDYVRVLMSSAEPATVGADGVSRLGFYGTLGTGAGVAPPMLEYNSVTTGFWSDTQFDGQDTTIGYIEKGTGWSVRFFELHDRHLQLTRSDVGVIFNDPNGLLIGFFDADGDGLDDSFDGDLDFGRDGGPIDSGDLVQQGVAFGELHIDQRTHFWTVELNHQLRLPRELCGAYWEAFCGLRFLEFKERFDVEGQLSVLADSFWNSEIENRIVGPQVGFRWFRQDGRFTFSGEGRAVAGLNFQTMTQVVSFGSRLSQIDGRGTDPSSAGPDLFRSRFDRFLARETVNANHEMEIAPIVELSAQASYAVTRKITLRAGLRAMYMEGIARPGAMINYSFPSMGFTDNNNQQVLMVGGSVGFDVNR